MKQEDLINGLMALWDEYTHSKNWWYSEDSTFSAFMHWLESDRP